MLIHGNERSLMSYLFNDKKFFSIMLKLASPIVLQHLIFSSLGLVDVIMIGQLGETAVAAVGIANQIFFLASLLFFGITSGMAIFTAQYWGTKDVNRIQNTLGLCLLMSLSGAFIFSIVAILFPDRVIGIYTTDPEVIKLGSHYLQIVAISYAATAITNSFSVVLRSTEVVKLPMLVSVLALSLNTLLNFGLIFGNFGFPEMGVVGAAIGTVSARLFETILLLLIIYSKKLPVAASLKNLINFRSLPLKKFFNTTIPVILTEIAWSLGITTYNLVFARIGTESIAAFNIANTISSLMAVIFIGLGNACAIMIGNRIGAGEKGLAIEYGKKYLLLTLIGSSVFGVLLIFITNPILMLYKVSTATIIFAKNILIFMAFSLPVRSLNFVLLIGILRSGGDTRTAFLIDAGVIWSVGVPLALLGAFVLKLPVHWVYLMVLTDEVVKLLLGLKRFFSQQWIHSLAVPT
jgi:putative MATE family efflux protein